MGVVEPVGPGPPVERRERRVADQLVVPVPAVDDARRGSGVHPVIPRPGELQNAVLARFAGQVERTRLAAGGMATGGLP